MRNTKLDGLQLSKNFINYVKKKFEEFFFKAKNLEIILKSKSKASKFLKFFVSKFDCSFIGG